MRTLTWSALHRVSAAIVQLHCVTGGESRGGGGAGNGGEVGGGEAAFCYIFSMTRKAEEPRCVRGFVAEK